MILDPKLDIVFVSATSIDNANLKKCSVVRSLEPVVGFILIVQSSDKFFKKTK